GGRGLVAGGLDAEYPRQGRITASVPSDDPPVSTLVLPAAVGAGALPVGAPAVVSSCGVSSRGAPPVVSVWSVPPAGVVSSGAGGGGGGGRRSALTWTRTSEGVTSVSPSPAVSSLTLRTISVSCTKMLSRSVVMDPSPRTARRGPLTSTLPGRTRGPLV